MLRPLRAALVRRLVCLNEPDTDSYRLLTGDFEDLKGLVAEKYGEVVVLHVLAMRAAITESLRDIARWYRDLFGVRAVYVRQNIGKQQSGPRAATAITLERNPLLGKPVASPIEIQERGLTFAIRPPSESSVGLYLDHRENRTRIRTMASGKDVLNLFAYTCGFSVAAAAGGAKTTVSVDLSPRYLEWGKTNFALNGLDPTRHEFIRSDAFQYLKRAKRRERSFDIIILDPPSFAHGRRRKEDFSLVRDLPRLVAAATDVLRPGGVLMVSTNLRRLSVRGLYERVREGAGRPHRVIARPPLPVDFAVDPDHAKTIFLRFA